MKKNKVLFMIPSIFIFLFMSLYPIFKIMVDVKNVQNVYFSLGSIVALLIFILLCIVVFIEIIYLINYLYTKIEMNVFYKLIWTVLLIALNVLIIPYFYMRYITKESKLVLKSIIYLLPIIVLSAVFFYGYKSYIEDINKIKAERKRIEEERNTYNTKDNVVSFTFRHGYKQENVGEYDLYVKNNQKKVIFTVYTYDTTLYEQTTPDQYIAKGISDIGKDKEKFDVFKQKDIIDKEDRVITTVEYKGKTKESSMCVYKISVISFKNKPNYLVYTVSVVTEKNYDLYIKEINEILNTSKIN
ncbi:MAG: hypothetical protein J6O56_02880 [Bacilli bacterium]|nr:hypothetical protein [Bacilli bacterium]